MAKKRGAIAAAPPLVARMWRECFDEEGLAALGHALRYAREHDLGFMEAADVVCPLDDSCVSDFTHLRAEFLDNLED